MKGAEGLPIGSGSAPCHSDVLLPKLQARKLPHITPAKHAA